MPTRCVDSTGGDRRPKGAGGASASSPQGPRPPAARASEASRLRWGAPVTRECETVRARVGAGPGHCWDGTRATARRSASLLLETPFRASSGGGEPFTKTKHQASQATGGEGYLLVDFTTVSRVTSRGILLKATPCLLAGSQHAPHAYPPAAVSALRR
jgi:hypothetical protein